MSNDNPKIKNFNPLAVIGICLIIGIAIGSILLYFIFGNLIEAFNKMLELKGQPSKTAPSIASLSYIVTWILTIYSIVVTAIFSYMVWKINNRSLIISEELKDFEVTSSNENKELTKQSLKISEELKRLEDIRELENKRSKALIVYYDLQRGFNVIRNLYIKHILKKDTFVLDQAFFDNNWIENIASLRSELTNKDIKELYDLYNSLYTIQKYLEVDDERLSSYIDKISNKLFLNFLPIELMENFLDHEIEELLSIENYILMQKIYKLTFSPDEISKKGNETAILSTNHYKILSGDLYSGEIVFYNSYGFEKIKGFFTEGEFTKGQYLGYFGSKPQYKIEYETVINKRIIINGVFYNYFFEPYSVPLIDAKYIENKPFEGTVIEVRKNGTIYYWGDLFDGLKQGAGKFYTNEGHLIFDGEIENGVRIKGELYAKGKLKFEGELKNEKPWTGKAYEVSLNNYYVEKFTGNIVDGKPYNGKGLIFDESFEFSSLDEKLFHEEAEENYHYKHEEQMDSEEYYEDSISWHNQSIREEYGEWEDYISADWVNGECKKKENKESNKVVYVYTNNKRK